MSSVKTKTKDGTKIKIEGAGLEKPISQTPTNKQINSMISGVQQGIEEHKFYLDAHGKEVASSTQGLLEATSLLLQEKNKHEHFQKLALFTRGSTKSGPTEGLAQATRNLMAQATGIGSKISHDANDVLAFLRETMLNLTTSSEFRQLTIEFISLLQSMMGQLQTVIKDTEPDQPLGERIRNRMFETDDELMDDINEKLSIFLAHISQQKEYQIAVRKFIRYSEELYDLLYNNVKDATDGLKESDDLRKSIDEAWEILNDFAGRTSNIVPRFHNNLRLILERARVDDELIAWIKESKVLLIDLMEHPDDTKRNCDRTSKMLRIGGVLSDKYRRDLEKIYFYAGTIMEKIHCDPVVVNFQNSLEKLAKDIALNDQGQPDLFILEKSMVVIRDLVIERFKKVLVGVPIKRIHVKNDALDIDLSNIMIEGNGLVPKNLHVELTSEFIFDFEKSTEATQRFYLRLRLDELRPHFKDVKYSFEKKSFPSIKDDGVADLFLEGSGLSTDVIVLFVMKGGQPSRAILETCTVEVDKVNLKIEQSKHDMLGAVLGPLIQSKIKTQLQRAVKDFIEGKVDRITEQLNDWFETKPFEQMMQKGNETMCDHMIAEAEEKREKEQEKCQLHVTQPSDADHKESLEYQDKKFFQPVPTYD